MLALPRSVHSLAFLTSRYHSQKGFFFLVQHSISSARIFLSVFFIPLKSTPAGTKTLSVDWKHHFLSTSATPEGSSTLIRRVCATGVINLPICSGVEKPKKYTLFWSCHSFLKLYCIVLYCIVLYCIVLYCIVLYCIVLYCIVLYCIVLYCIVLYCIVSYCRQRTYLCFTYLIKTVPL